MKRKIAAIMAADVAGYGKLVAEDEEETLRRLQSYRAVFQDFIARFGGRIFNTAGDAVLAEFSSAVEAVRCAIDVQESLRTRNLAYPASRQMSFRIGITVGDVVERDGDLLGDGVNIAARLEGLAQPGGLCVSRTVYEQVANKLSVEFVDIGEQEVKNIPTPIHAYALPLGALNAGAAARAMRGRAGGGTGIFRPTNIAMTAAIGAALVLLSVMMLRNDSSVPPLVVAEPGPPPTPTAQAAPPDEPRAVALRPETVPFIADRQREAIRNDYLPAPDHKALAISSLVAGFITDQRDDETAKSAALAACQRTTEAIVPALKCELYAVGNTVVTARGRPPMPPAPWLVRDATVETPFAANDVPLVNDTVRTVLARTYAMQAKPKALAVGPQGNIGFYSRIPTADEAVRRALEWCGSNAGVPCMIVAVDDVFVVPLPRTMKAIGFFRAGGNAAIAGEAREEVARRIGNVTGSWNASRSAPRGSPDCPSRPPTSGAPSRARWRNAASTIVPAA
jgi:adenylate cyclase